MTVPNPSGMTGSRISFLGRLCPSLHDESPHVTMQMQAHCHFILKHTQQVQNDTRVITNKTIIENNLFRAFFVGLVLGAEPTGGMRQMSTV